MASFHSPLPAQDDAARHAAELERLQSRIQALQATLDRDLDRRDSARAALRGTEQTVARQVATLRDIERRLAAGAERLDRLAGERDRRDAELAAEREALAAQVRAAHALGRQDRLKLLLNQQDPAAVGRTLVYYDYLNRSRVRRIERVATLLREVAELEDRLQRERQALQSTRDEQRAALDALSATRDRRAAAIAAIERELRAGGARLTRLQADEQRLQRLLQSLSDLLADVPAQLGDQRRFAQLRGELAWPARGGVVRRYGQRVDGGQRSQGLLIGAPAGTEVRAIAYGRVAWAGWMPHYGNLMVIEHGDEYYTLYAHNQVLLREVGEWVGAGEPVARVGDSGGQRRSALYFELRKGRTPLNPQQWLGSE